MSAGLAQRNRKENKKCMFPTSRVSMLPDSNSAGGPTSASVPIFRGLLHYLVTGSKMLDQTRARDIDPSFQNVSSQLNADSTESGMDLDVSYFYSCFWVEAF